MAIEVTKNENTEKVSLLEMASGAIKEACDVEVGKVIENILDPNTAATKKREISIKITFTPSADRTQVNIEAQSQSKLQPNNPVQTALFCGKQGGKTQAIELVPNIPGQLGFSGEEQEQPKELKLG